MRGILAIFALLFLASFVFAGLAYVKDIAIRDTGKWGNLSMPSDVWPNGDTVYVLDTDNHRIVEFYKGEPQKLIVGSVGPTKGMLFPEALWVAEDSRFYIADRGNNAIVYENGHYLYELAISGSDTYSFDHPAGVAVYGGIIYIADSERGTIKMFSQKDKTFEGTIGSKGFGNSELFAPTGIYIRDGLLYVADSGNSRIQVFKLYDGSYLKTIRGAYGCALNAPHGIAVSRDRFMFVSDTGNNRVVVFDGDFNCVGSVNGSAAVPMSEPRGIKVDDSNDVYVADSGNAMVRVFHYTPYYQSKEEAAKKIDAAGAVYVAISGMVSAATYLGISFEDKGKELLGKANAEYAGGNYSNAYFNATLSASETEKLNASLSLKIQSEVLRIVLGDESALDSADQDALRYGLKTDSRPLRADLSRIRAMLDAGKYQDAAFNSSIAHTKVLGFRSMISGSSNETAKTRETLLLAISDNGKELDTVSISASQYNISINSTDIKFILDNARESCDNYDFDRCRELLSSAKGKLNDAHLVIAAHIARVEAARLTVSAAHEELSKAQATSYFFKPDLSKAEAELKSAEEIVSENPDAAVEKAKDALALIEESKAGINRANLLTLIGIGAAVLLLVAVVVVYYVTRGKPRKRRGQ